MPHGRAYFVFVALLQFALASSHLDRQHIGEVRVAGGRAVPTESVSCEVLDRRVLKLGRQNARAGGDIERVAVGGGGQSRSGLKWVHKARGGAKCPTSGVRARLGVGRTPAACSPSRGRHMLEDRMPPDAHEE